MKFELFLAVFFCVLLIPIQSSCHYSCQNCTSLSYTSCSSCPNNASITYALSLNPTVGTCAQFPANEANGLGIILIIMVICITPIFMLEQIVHLFLFLQTLGLFYLVEVFYTPVLHYILSGCSYLMLISKMTYGYKNANLSIKTDILKGRFFFGSFSFISNIAVIGVINLILFLTLFFLPLFKNLRKQCVTQGVKFCPDWLIDKIILATSTAFIFLIQQTVAVIYFSLKNDEFSVLEVILTILYFFMLIAFTINQFFYPFIFFRSKFAQLNMILAKTIMPIFLATSTASHFIIYPVINTFFIIDAAVTNKNNRSGSFNRLLAYKIFAILLLVLLTVQYGVELQVKSSQISKILGYICFLGIIGIFIFLILELTLNVKSIVCKKQLTQTQKSQIKDTTMQTIEISRREEQKAHVFVNSLYLQEPKSQIIHQMHHSKAEPVIPEISDYGQQRHKSFDNIQSIRVCQSEIKKTQGQQEGNEKIGNVEFLQANSENYWIQNKSEQINENLENSKIKEAEQKDRPKRLAKRKKDKRSSK